MVQLQTTICYHCGDDCKEEEVLFQDKSFCCYGCRAVYELIESSNLHQYYQNAELKAEKVNDSLTSQRKYAFLDLPKVTSQLIRFQDETRSLVRFYLAGIHCSSCIYLLEHLPKLNKHIFHADVNFIKKEVTINYDHNEISLKEIAVLLADLGYPPTINLDSLDQTSKRTSANNIGIKIAVAGFCFGNSMLISLPEYLDVGFQLDTQFKSVFGLINILLSLPVVLYAANEYFISSWKGIKHGYLNIDVPISLGIFTLFSRSLFEILSQTGPGYVDSLAGLVFFLLIGKWYQGKTYQALSFDRDYKSYFPISISRIDSGREELVTVEDLKSGDRILVHNQELIPADGIIVSGEGNIDYSFVTGEAQPVSKEKDAKVFAGGRQVGPQLTVELTREVVNSELTQLWNNQSPEKVSNNYDLLIDRIARYFTVAIILIAAATGVYWLIADPTKIWNSVTAVLIVACPCALALTLPFAFGHSIRLLGKKGFYLKKSNVIEQLANIKNIVFDKTGTLTKSDPMNISFHGSALSAEEIALIKSITSNSAHPLSKLIYNHLNQKIEKLPLTAFEEIVGKGITGEVGSNLIQMGSANFLKIKEKEELHESRVYVEINHKNKGYFSVKADYRKGIFDWLIGLKSSYSLHLLSGDNDSERANLSPYFHNMAFDQKPNEKRHYVDELKDSTLMIGDGLNDAGALNTASVGVAVCEDVHQFSPACDALLSANSIGNVSNILRFSKGVIHIVIIAFLLSFLYNVVGLSFAVTGNLTPVISAILMPISSVTVVGFITLAIHFLAKLQFKKEDSTL